MKKRIISLLLVLAMLLGILPAAALANDGTTPSRGTVYLSISDDDKYVYANDDAGTIMAYVPVSIDDVAEAIHLEDYGLEQYLVMENGQEMVSVLHLYLYAHKMFYKDDSEIPAGVQGGAGSLFMTQFWGHDCNLTYYCNGEYSLQAENWGATADIMPLTDGDFIDVSMYTSWDFYSDSAAGYHYFLDETGTITHDYTVADGEALHIGYGRSWDNGMGEADGTALVAEPYAEIFYSQTMYGDDALSVETDDNGNASITFPSAGTWYLWGNGMYGAEWSRSIVSSPAYAKVTVEAAEEETYPVTITAPADSTVSIGTMNNYYVYNFAEPLAVKENGDTVVYGFNVPTTHGNSFVRVQHPDGVTYWDYTNLSDGTAINITEDDLFMNDDKHNSDTIIHDLSEYEMDVADVYINANAQGYMDLDVRETFEFNVFRDWHAVEGISNAKTALPDVSYEVIDFDGQPSDVVTVVPDSNNSSVATMTANKEGTAIVLVTYDAMYSTAALHGGIGTDASTPEFFSAIWPENTGVLVVTVGADGSAIKTNMTLNRHALDAEHDVLYYVGDEGASYTFTPESGCEVSVARATLTADSLTYSGFETVEANTDGSFTVSGLTAGNHIVMVEKDGLATYQVIATKQTTVTVTDADGNEISEANPAEPGETLTIQLGDLYNPVNKLSGVYNSHCVVIYVGEDGKTGNGSSGSSFGYYLFASDPEVHKAKFVMPEVWAEDTYSLSGYFNMGGFGSSAGAHRNVTYAVGKSQNNNAPATSGALGRLPEITIPVNASEQIPAQDITLNQSELNLSTGGTAVLTAVITPEDSTDKINWTSSDSAIAAVDENGVVTGVATGQATITATAGGATASCTVTVSNETAEDIVLIDEGAYYNEVYASTMCLSEITICGVPLAGELSGIQVMEGQNVIRDEGTCTIPLKAGEYDSVTITLKPLLGMAGNSAANAGKLAYYCNDAVSDGLNVYANNDFAYTTSVPLTWEADGTATVTVGTILNGKARSTYTLVFTQVEPADPAVEAVEAAINALPAEDALTLEDADAVAAARTAYDALSAEQQALVSEEAVAKLETAEAKIAKLQEEAIANANKEAAKTVEDAINALPAEDALTLEDADAVAAARTAYAALTAEQQALVSEEAVAKLEAAEAKIAKLQEEANKPVEPVEPPFTDVKKSAWYYKAVAYAYTNNLMNGTSATTFAPEGTMTRSMVVTVLYRLAGSPAVDGDCQFTDCKSGSFYYNAVIWAAENGITAGTSSTTFAPDAEVTREQMATFLYRYAKLEGCDMNVSETASLNAYADAASVSGFASKAMLWVVDNGIMNGATSNGKTVLAPQDSAIRAQVATILMRFCENVAE